MAKTPLFGLFLPLIFNHDKKEWNWGSHGSILITYMPFICGASSDGTSFIEGESKVKRCKMSWEVERDRYKITITDCRIYENNKVIPIDGHVTFYVDKNGKYSGVGMDMNVVPLLQHNKLSKNFLNDFYDHEKNDEDPEQFSRVLWSKIFPFTNTEDVKWNYLDIEISNKKYIQCRQTIFESNNLRDNMLLEVKKCLSKYSKNIQKVPRTESKIERLVFLDPISHRPHEIFNRNVVECMAVIQQIKLRKSHFVSAIKMEWILLEWDNQDYGKSEDQKAKLSPAIQEKYNHFLSLVKNQVNYLKPKCISMGKIFQLP